jgi:hypothetical protein
MDVARLKLTAREVADLKDEITRRIAELKQMDE